VAIPPACLSGTTPIACNAVTFDPSLNYYWHGIDTNFVWRGPWGLRVNGGTSSGHTSREICASMVDAPAVRGREGNEYQSAAGVTQGCAAPTIWTTRVNGSAAYVVPKVDVLVSTVFQSVPGAQIAANFTYNKNDITWNAASASRATEPCTGVSAALGTGCLGTTRGTSTVVIPLLLANEMMGERTTVFDLKLAKNIRFKSKRATIGVDIYNFLNSDAISSYNGTISGSFVNGVWTPAVDNPATAANEGNQWLNPTGLVSPRFARLSLQFNF
jgi:hypothetical protein